MIPGAGLTQQKVAPNQKLSQLTRQFKVLLLVEALILAPLFVSGQFWILILLISMGFGWYSIKDDNAHHPPSMQCYFFINVFGVVYSLINVALYIQFLLQRKPSTLILACLLVAWITSVCILILASRVSWVMYKEMMSCPPVLPSEHAGGLPYRNANMGSYAASGSYGFLAGGNNQQTNQEDATAHGFTAFQGEGRRLGA